MAKSRDLIAPVLGDGQCNKLIDKVLGPETVNEVRELSSPLQIR